DLRSEHAALAVAHPRLKGGEILEPFDEQIRVAVEVLMQVVGREHQAHGQALSIRINESSHVQVYAATPQGAVAQQHLVGDAFLRPDAERLFNRARRQVDDLFDSLKKLGGLAL